MPYSDRDMHRACDRESKRRKRSGAACLSPGEVSTPEETTLAKMRVQRAQDLMDLLEEQINAVRLCSADVVTKARTIGTLVGTGARIIEAKDLEERLRALEDTLSRRKRK